MVNAYAHPSLVVGHVIHAVGNRLAQAGILEVVNPHFLRLALEAAIPARRCLKFPTNSFFFVSTETTGWPRR